MTRKYQQKSAVFGLVAALLLGAGAGSALAQTATSSSTSQAGFNPNPTAAQTPVAGGPTASTTTTGTTTTSTYVQNSTNITSVTGGRAAAGTAGPAALTGTFTSSFTSSPTIAGTKHNLGANGSGPNTFSGTTEICVFCHTPHGSDTTAAVPLWNRSLNHGQTYNTYDQLGTSSLKGGVAPVGSVSLACLSCHDGTQAMNLMINQPGSGWGNANGGGTAMVNGGGTVAAQELAGSWTGCGQLNCDATDVVWIGTDLRNDHPVGVEYCGGGLTATAGTTGSAAVTGTCNNPDFVKPKAKYINGNTVFWVDTNGGQNNIREKTDIQLYTRDFTGINNAAGQGGPGEPSVECASCHDPHNGTNPTFLRVSNNNSGVCLSCHVK